MLKLKVMSRLLQLIAKSVTIFIGPYHILGQSVTIIGCSISDQSHYIFIWLQPGVLFINIEIATNLAIGSNNCSVTLTLTLTCYFETL